ncbi:hypothetical protein TD95_004514 [Thielaviopsis punctulata]|uniref:Uncharacterized protein n=1 Tax=Thielaviopsis punctulata TaxID=72032 RepID=A0A0F4ZL24_9PEZI|nr:hypothetical protein TD95_004514 [Thielaviopsis punctulata]
MAADDDHENLQSSFLSRLDGWGKSSMPAAGLATLITALHWRPMQPVPALVISPTLLFASYINVAGFPTDSAGLTASMSGLYALLALRRKQKIHAKFFSTRGLVRGAALGMAAFNCLASSYVYSRGDRKEDLEMRIERNRWGDYDDKQ